MIIILVLLVVYTRVHSYFERDFIMARVKFYHYFVFYFLQLLLGMLIGLEKFVEEFKKEGKWSTNISRLLIMGVPTLIISIQALKVILPPSINLTYLGIISSGIIIFPRVFLGYLIITSFLRQDFVEGTKNNA